MTRIIALLFVLSSGLTLPLAAHAAGEKVEFDAHSYKVGTIIIKTGAHELYQVLSESTALRYSVGVGADGMRWLGRKRIDAKYIKPAWQERPGSPAYPGGSPKNPMGAAALTMRDVNYAIHGTNDESSIGKSVSHGCIRMHNEDILELYQKVTPGQTEVIVQP